MTTPQPTWQTPLEPTGPAPGVEFAGHGARLVGFILDVILLTAAATTSMLIIILVVFGSLDWSVDANGDVVFGDTAAAASSFGLLALGSVLISILTILYFPFFWARGGRTPGMRVAGTRVVNDRDGSQIGWGTAFLRLIGYWISGAVFYIGFAWILIDARRRGWHDLIAGTCVISAS